MQSSSLGISLKVKDWRAGVPLPICPSRFHRTSIHTMLDERLGIPPYTKVEFGKKLKK